MTGWQIVDLAMVGIWSWSVLMSSSRDFRLSLARMCSIQQMIELNRTQVQVSSAQWMQVDYQIQLATGKSSVRIINMFKFEGPSEPNSKQRVDGIVNVTDFSRDYSTRVVQKTIPLEDVLFYCGHLNIHEYAHIPSKIFNVFVCRVALGKIGNPKTDVTGCDSIFVEPQVESEAFQYNFFLRAHSQYEVRYEVSFTVADDKEFKLSELECSNCENRVPKVYCKPEKLYFCEDCSREHHKTKLMLNHELQKPDKINTLPLCKNHNTKNEFYCLKCQKYLCLVCTQKGLHHQNHEHPIKPIYYLYEQKRENVELLPRRHLEKLHVLTDNLQTKKDEIHANYESVRKFIISQYEKALGILEDLMREKITLLNSYEIELRMINQRIQWSKAFIKFQEKSLKPLYFFQSAQRFEEELSRLRISDFEGIFVAKADIAAEGYFTVARKEVLDRSTKPVNPIRLEQPDSLPTQRDLYEFNPVSEPPKKGDLALIIENSNLNFFLISPT